MNNFVRHFAAIDFELLIVFSGALGLVAGVIVGLVEGHPDEIDGATFIYYGVIVLSIILIALKYYAKRRIIKMEQREHEDQRQYRD